MSDVSLLIEKEKLSLRGKVEEKLRLAIISGAFAPGQRLIERELCTLLGVGRTSVREAMRHLEAEGLIVGTPHRGLVVTTITSEEAGQLYAIRAVLEGYLGRRCAERADAAFVDRLDAVLQRFKLAAVCEGREEIIAAKEAFYEVLFTGCGNTFICQMLTSIHNRINLVRFKSMAQPGRLQSSIFEIDEIADAIRAANPGRAEQACRRHVDAAARVALEYMQKLEIGC